MLRPANSSIINGEFEGLKRSNGITMQLKMTYVKSVIVESFMIKRAYLFYVSHRVQIGIMLFKSLYFKFLHI
jgi:hypothetical protein